MLKLCDTLKHLMTEAQISADELARQTGVPASTIKKIRNHHNPNPTLASLIPLANFFSVSLDELVGNKSHPTIRHSSVSPSEHTSVLQVPILSWKEAVYWPDRDGGTLPLFVSTDYPLSKNAFALILDTDEWNNLAKGMTLFVDPALRTDHLDYAIVYKKGQILPTFKQVLYEDGQIYLKSFIQGLNIVAMSSEYKFLGVVVEFKKKLKNHHNNKRVFDARNSII